MVQPASLTKRQGGGRPRHTLVLQLSVNVVVCEYLDRFLHLKYVSRDQTIEMAPDLDLLDGWLYRFQNFVRDMTGI